MRKRLLITMVFGMAGLATALPIGDRLGIGAPEAMIGGAVAGVLLGYVLSVFLDIFLNGSTHEAEN